MPHTLLLADDSVTIQRVIELTFADEDVTVVAVGDGDQAIERLEASPPDIVLADVGMPGKSGYEVAQYIRRSPRLEHIPVVLLTGAFEPVDQARADDAKCDGVLAKPFEPQMVIGRVKELLGRPQRAATDRTAPGTEIGTSFGEPPAETQVHPAQADLNVYFDRLDNAFNRGASGISPDAAVESKSRSAAGGLDWFSALGHSEGAQPPEPPIAVDPVPDLPLHQPSWRVDEPLALQHLSEPAPIADINPEQADARAAEPFAAIEAALPASIPATHDEAPALDAPAATYAQGFEPETPPEPAAESRPVESRLVQATTSPAERVATVEPMQIASVVPTIAASPSAPSRRVPLKNPAPVPPLADAFAALLAAEQGAATPAVSWPASSSPVTVSEATIETITRRVLDRLSDAVVRQTVSDLVSTIAERLAREEIERIKASIK